MSPASPRPWLLVLLVLGCAPGTSSKDTGHGDPPDDPTDTNDTTDTTDTDDTDDSDDSDDSGESGPVDEDGDGHLSDVDCDDRDPLTYPGAPETWNAIDDDCDGRADADGPYVGRAQIAATAIFEGETYAFALDCPAELDRSGPAILLSAVCTPDPTDEMAQRLLGETLTWSIETSTASQASWVGRGTLTSSDGWDIWVDSSLEFADFQAVAATASRSTVSLSMTGLSELRAE